MTYQHPKNRNVCHPDYVCDFFDVLDSKIPDVFKTQIDSLDVLYLFEFNSEASKGRLTIYKDYSKDGVKVRINPTADFVNHGKLWFSRIYPISNTQKYLGLAASFTEPPYLELNLNTPLFSITLDNIPSLAPLKEARKVVVENSKMSQGKEIFNQYYQKLKSG